MTLILPLQPRELQSISRLTARADSPSVISSLFKVTLSISTALKFSNFLILKLYNHVPKFPIGCIDGLRRLLCGTVIAREEPIRNNTPAILNSTQLSEAMEPESITISSVASLESQRVTIDSDSNEPTFPYAFVTQHPIVLLSLNDLNLPPNPFNVLATMAVIQQDQEDSPQSPEPSDPSPISTPPMTLSTIEGWETPHTTTDDNTFYLSENEPRRVYWDFSAVETFESHKPRRVYSTGSPSSTSPPPPRQKRKLRMGMSFPHRGGSVAAHLRGMRPSPSTKKDNLMLREKLKL